MAKRRLMSARLSMDEFEEHMEGYDGFCTACGEWSGGGCEPDARNYVCEACGAEAVFGAEELNLMGLVDLADDDEGE